jgi:hypothetical protein
VGPIWQGTPLEPKNHANDVLMRNQYLITVRPAWAKASIEPDVEHERKSEASGDDASLSRGSINSSIISRKNGKSNKVYEQFSFSLIDVRLYCPISRTSEIRIGPNCIEQYYTNLHVPIM